MRIRGLLTCVMLSLLVGCSTTYRPSGFLGDYFGLTKSNGLGGTRVALGISFNQYDAIWIPPVDTTLIKNAEHWEDVAERFRMEVRSVLENIFRSSVLEEKDLPRAGKNLRFNLFLTSLGQNVNNAFEGKLIDLQTGKEIAAFAHEESRWAPGQDVNMARPIWPLTSDKNNSLGCVIAWSARIGKWITEHWGQAGESYGYIVGHFKVDDKLEPMPSDLPPLKDWDVITALPNKNTKLFELFPSVKMPSVEGYFVWKLKPGEYEFPQIELQSGLWKLKLPWEKRSIYVGPSRVTYIGHLHYKVTYSRPDNKVIKTAVNFLEKLGAENRMVKIEVLSRNDGEDMQAHLKKELPGQNYIFDQRVAERYRYTLNDEDKKEVSGILKDMNAAPALPAASKAGGV